MLPVRTFCFDEILWTQPARIVLKLCSLCVQVRSFEFASFLFRFYQKAFPIFTQLEPPSHSDHIRHKSRIFCLRFFISTSFFLKRTLLLLLSLLVFLRGNKNSFRSSNSSFFFAFPSSLRTWTSNPLSPSPQNQVTPLLCRTLTTTFINVLSIQWSENGVYCHRNQ